MIKSIKKKQRTKYYVVTDGEWVRPAMRKAREMCCGCALTHIVDYRVVNGHVEYRATVCKKATAAARRAFKFTKDDEE